MRIVPVRPIREVRIRRVEEIVITAWMRVSRGWKERGGRTD